MSTTRLPLVVQLVNCFVPIYAGFDIDESILSSLALPRKPARTFALVNLPRDSIKKT